MRILSVFANYLYLLGTMISALNKNKLTSDTERSCVLI